VASAIKNVYTELQETLKIKSTLSLSLSADNKIIIEGEPFSGKNMRAIGDIIIYFKNFEIENLTFNLGVSQKEIEDFIRLLTVESGAAKKSGGINKAFQDKGIQNIKVDQFSYVKIKKDQGVVLAGARGSPLDKLKTKIQGYAQGKIAKPGDIQGLEQEIIDTICLDVKEKKKISVAVKNVLKRFIQYIKEEKESFLLKLKDSLLNSGLPGQEVDGIMTRLKEEVSERPITKPQAIIKEETSELKDEAGIVTTKLNALQQELVEKTRLLEQIDERVRKISHEKERIDNIVHYMAEGLVVLDAEGKILMVNPTGEALLGITSQDIGKPLKDVVKDEHLLTLAKGPRPDKSGVMEEEIELFATDESTKKTLRTSSAVVHDSSGKTIGMVTTLNDVTKQRELERMKASFVASVSHELRTPLVAMEKSISLILNKTTGPITSDQEQFLSIAERNLKRLAILINDLLDLSKLEAGKMILKRQPSSLEKIITESIDGLDSWAKTRAIKIDCRIQEVLPEVNIDPDRIIQVLNNLIGNAIKYTPDNGSITVECLLKKEKDEIEISITDTGIGIDKENLPKVFDKFYQIREKASSDMGGTGIGLSIAREIMELHGGKIWVESEKGHGSKFTFTLPLN
jgi:PAS domain S-box-containing protein